MAALKTSVKKYFDESEKALKKEFPKRNLLSLPEVEKVVINAGVGRYEKAEIEEIQKLLEKLTGQKVKTNASRVSIAGFKLRAGEINGLSTTLRGDKARDLLFSLVYLALPRTKDFKGLKLTAFDSNKSCYSVGIPDAGIFPQIGFGNKVNFGLQINICFKNSSEENRALLEKMNFPFKK